MLNDYWNMFYYEDNKEMNLRLFKLKFSNIFNDVDDDLFKEIFGHTSVKLADKLINTTSKEENQMLINDIEINRDKIFEQDKFSKFVIQPTHKHGNLLDMVKIILKFNEVLSLYLTQQYCQSVAIKQHTTTIIEGKTNKIPHKTLDGIHTAKILNIQINNSIISDI